jgi:hypothetical protein
MSSPERRRLNRLERRCDWLLARIAIGESKGRDMSFDVAELSALRWLIDTFGTQYVDLVTENHALKRRIHNQRKAIRSLLARQQPGALSDNELEALVDVVVTSPSVAAPAVAAHEPGKEHADAE